MIAEAKGAQEDNISNYRCYFVFRHLWVVLFCKFNIKNKKINMSRVWSAVSGEGSIVLL